MPLHFVVLLAGIQGLSEALPISRSGHDAVAWIWLDPGPSGAHLENLLHFATASALLVAARQRLVAAASAGLLAITRPTLFRSSAPAHHAAVIAIAACTSLLVRVFVNHYAAPWKSTPVAVGFGLLLTSLLLITTRDVDRVLQDEPSILMAIVLGLGHGMATLPGASEIGTALVLLAWMGTKNELALDLAMILSAITLVAEGFQFFSGGFSAFELPIPLVILAMITAFLGTTVAIRGTRYLLEKRSLALAACWTVTLGLATLAYARASATGFGFASLNGSG